jgi:hypothetical protein
MVKTTASLRKDFFSILLQPLITQLTLLTQAGGLGWDDVAPLALAWPRDSSLRRLPALGAEGGYACAYDAYRVVFRKDFEGIALQRAHLDHGFEVAAQYG